MAGLLNGDYGAGEERGARVINILVVSVLALTVIAFAFPWLSRKILNNPG